VDLRDAYRVLEIAPGSTKDATREARNILAKVWHPDRHQGDDKVRVRADAKLKEINEAYALIERAGFPKKLESNSEPPRPTPGPEPSSSPRPTNAQSNGEQTPPNREGTPPPPRTSPQQATESTPPPRPTNSGRPATADPKPVAPRSGLSTTGVFTLIAIGVAVVIIVTQSNDDHVERSRTYVPPAYRYMPSEPPSPASSVSPAADTNAHNAIVDTEQPRPERPAVERHKPPTRTRREPSRDNSEKDDASASAKHAVVRTFAVGSSAADVIAAQGQPERVIGQDFNTEIWQYGPSTVTLRGGHVREYSNLGDLHVR
jgi:hypothetical protein